MQHSDPDVLALVALGEPASPTDAQHLRTCRACRDEVASFARVVSGVRVDVGDLDDLAGETPVAPPPRVWDAIAASTGVTAAPRPERVAGDHDVPGRRGLTAVPDDMPRELRPPATGTATGTATGPATGPVTRRAARRGSAGRGDRPRLLLAVAASLVVGAAAGVAGTSLLADDPVAQPAAPVLAQVDLKNLKATAATGRAIVVQTPTGPHIRVDTSQLATPKGGFYEVWLIDKQVKRMVGIGILHPGEDEFAVPNGVDLSQYPIVDISVQQPGDPTHSGNSILRGTIST